MPITEPLTRLSLQRHIAATRVIDNVGGRVVASSDHRRSRQPDIDFRVGRVFEILWVNDGTTGLTVVSEVAASRASRHNASKRKFVVLRESEEGVDEFTALAIWTYSREGVGSSGVIKSDHTVIYSTKDEPRLQPSEFPQRFQGGSTENGVRHPGIRVRMHDRATKLDVMSRLELKKVYLVKHHIPVKFLGQADGDSISTLVQHRWSVAQPQREQQLQSQLQTQPLHRAENRRVTFEQQSLPGSSTTILRTRNDDDRDVRQYGSPVGQVGYALASTSRETAERSQRQLSKAPVQEPVQGSQYTQNATPTAGSGSQTSFSTEMASLALRAKQLGVKGPQLSPENYRKLANDKNAWTKYKLNLKTNWQAESAAKGRSRTMASSDEDSGESEDEDD